MFVMSNSARPSTSRSALISTLEPKVDTPDTFKLSSSVCPSISTEALISTLEPKVETPDTFKLSSSACPLTSSSVRVPRFVRDELTTFDPSVLLDKTSTPLIL